MKTKLYYKTWRRERYTMKEGQRKIHLLPMLSFENNNGTWIVRVGWLTRVYVFEKVEGYSLSYLDHE